MRVLSCILYGFVLGRWFTKTRRRLFPTSTPGRYVVIAELCNCVNTENFTDRNTKYVMVGRLNNSNKAPAVYDAIDNSMFFMPRIYDSWNPEGAKNIARYGLTTFSELSADEKLDLAEARRLCDVEGS